MKAFSSKKIFFAALVALASLLVTMGAGIYSSILAPRSYQYHRPRDVLDLVSDIFRAPIYGNSFLKHPLLGDGVRSRDTSLRYFVSEDSEFVQLEMELPGVSSADLVVELENKAVLRIKGTRKYPGTKSVEAEIEESNFDLSFQLADDVDSGRLSASLSAGILRVRVPRKEKTVKRIEIEADVNEVQTVELNINAMADAAETVAGDNPEESIVITSSNA